MSMTEEELLRNAGVALRRYCYSSQPIEAEIPMDYRVVSGFRKKFIKFTTLRVSRELEGF